MAARPPHRAWLLVPAGLSLLAGLDAALLLLGLPAPVRVARLADVHGPLMVLGFLGTLIALERAVALRAPWGYAAPALLGAGGLALVSPLPALPGQVLLVDGAWLLVGVQVALWRRSHDEAVAVEGLAAVMAACGALLWLRVPVSALLPWLVGFVVLVIAAERVELARVALGAGAGQRLVVHAALVVVAAGAATVWGSLGSRLFGAALLALVAWLARHDVARRTIRSRGLPRFSAAGMLAGHTWLAVAGALWLVAGKPTATTAYDVAVHTVFLGFAMSMVMAHAPVILPAVLRRPLPYRPVLWLPLGVLHLSLAVRVAGDALGSPTVWRVGGVGTVVALLLLPAVAVPLVLTARPAARTSRKVVAA